MRTPNNTATDYAVMAAMKSIAFVNTQLAANSTSGTGQVYVDDPVALSQGSFPAVLLESIEPQEYMRHSSRANEGVLAILLTYYDRWDTQIATLDSVWAGIAADLERIKANLETNDALVVAYAPTVRCINHLALSPYYGDVDESIPGIALAYRHLTILLALAPYDM